MAVDKHYLINKIRGAERRYEYDPGRGDPIPLEEWRVVITTAERDSIVAALQKTLAHG